MNNGQIERFETGIQIQEGVSLGDYIKWAGEFLEDAGRMDAQIPFLVGDLINYGEEHWPEEYAQVLDSKHLSEAKLKMWTTVCRNVPLQARRLDVSLTHHLKVCRLDHPRSQEAALKHAAENGWTVRELDEYLKEAYPNDTKAGRPKKVLREFQPWLEEWAEQNGYTLEENEAGEGIWLHPEVVELMRVAWNESRSKVVLEK